MTELPVWLLDVDGVLNAVQTHKPPRSTGWPDDCWRYLDGLAGDATFPIVAAEPVLEFIRAVHEDGLAEVRWLTTWEAGDYIDGLAEALDLPQFPIAGRLTEEAPESGTGWFWWWKLPIAQRVYGETRDRRLVWTDDDISYHRPAKQWAASQPRGTLLALSPNTGTGLIPVHLDKIRRFLEAPSD